MKIGDYPGTFMPITSQTFVRSTAILLLVGLLALLGIVGTNVWLVERSQGYFNEVTDGRIARRHVVNLRTLLQSMESSQRGFIITGDERYLEPYEAALPQVEQQFNDLSNVLSEYTDSAEFLSGLRTDIDLKLAELTETVASMRAGDTEGAVAQVRSDVGEEVMIRIQTFLDQLMEGIDERLAQGAENQNATTNALRWVAIGGGIVILLVVGGAMWAVLSYTRELARARATVEELNAGLEDRVKERTADLGKANEEIQRFAYIVTHDLRAPLVNIMGFTSELETSVEAVKTYMEARPADKADPADEEARLAATEDLPEAITFIRAATRKMDGLINAILKISREGRRQLKPESVDLSELASSSAAAVHHQVADSDGEISTDIRVGRIVTDKLSIEQVLGNLLDNAIKYQQPGRPLRVSVRARHLPANRVLIEVEDNGRGIADTDHERVFELFRRSGTQTHPGEGIGLAHVRTMVRSLGGDVTLTSKLGEGTTFIINLPRDLRSYLGSFGP
jgi:signal transduction histidine kinase